MNDEQSATEQKTLDRGTARGSKKARRGFAAMPPEQVRELSRLGGLAAHRAGKAHEFTREEARAAGRKGGMATQAKRRDSSDKPGP
jgi:general stress protein YciG